MRWASVLPVSRSISFMSARLGFGPVGGPVVPLVIRIDFGIGRLGLGLVDMADSGLAGLVLVPGGPHGGRDICRLLGTLVGFPVLAGRLGECVVTSLFWRAEPVQNVGGLVASLPPRLTCHLIH